MNDLDEERLRRYRAMLPINKHRLDDDLEHQAATQEEISEQVTRATSRMAELKDELAKVEARLTEDFREAERSTKDTVEAKVKRHKDRVDAWQRLQGAIRAHMLWDGLLDAWKGRGKDLQALGRLFGDQYFTLTSISARAPRPQRPSREGRQEYARSPRMPLED